MIKKKIDQPLLSRTEYLIELEFEGGILPKEKAKEKVIEEIKSDKNLTVIKNIKPHFGEQKADVLVYVYKDEKVMKDLEKTKKKQKEEKKTEEEQKSEDKEEKKEQKEEKKTEEEGKEKNNQKEKEENKEG